MTPPGAWRQFERQRRLAAGRRPCDKRRAFGPDVRDDYVATLISNPADPALDDAVIDLRAPLLPRRLQPNGLRPASPPTSPYDGAGISRDRGRATACRARRPPDRRGGAAAGRRRKKLFVADMDSTMIGQECIDELADFRRAQGACLRHHRTRHARRDRVRAGAARTRGAAEGPAGHRGRRGHRERITLTPGGRELVGTMRSNGAYTCLVSGGFTLFTKAIAAKIGFRGEPRQHASRRRRQARGPGRRADPRSRGEARDAQRTARRSASTPTRRWRSATAPTISRCSSAPASASPTTPSPRSRRPPHARIDHGDLTALLYAQGYRREEFATV